MYHWTMIICRLANPRRRGSLQRFTFPAAQCHARQHFTLCTSPSSSGLHSRDQRCRRSPSKKLCRWRDHGRPLLMADFGVIANAFGVVGLADILFRSATQLYDLARRANAAPETLAQLHHAVQGFNTAITEVQQWAREYSQSHFATNDGQTVPPELQGLLLSCAVRCKELSSRLQKQRTGIGSWIGSTRVALSETDIRQSIQLLNSSTLSIQAILQARAS